MKELNNLTTLSFSEAAKQLRTDHTNISRLVNDGKLGFIAFDKFQKNKRIPIVELERYLKENTVYKIAQ